MVTGLVIVAKNQLSFTSFDKIGFITNMEFATAMFTEDRDEDLINRQIITLTGQELSHCYPFY